MTQRIDSSALELTRRALGLAGGTQAAQQTFLDDGNVDQALSINQIASASQPGGFVDQGMIYGVVSYSVAGGASSGLSFDPYAPGYFTNLKADEIEPYDLWLAGITCESSSVGGAGISAACKWVWDSTKQPGIGAGSVTVPGPPLAIFSDFTVATGGGRFTGVQLGVTPFARFQIRVPRAGNFSTSITNPTGGSIGFIWGFIFELVPRGLRPSTFGGGQ